MLPYGESFTAFYRCWDTDANAWKTGDSANHTIYLVRDGTKVAANDATSDEVDSTNLPGLYSLVITASEAEAELIVVGGKSTDATHIIFGERYELESPDAAMLRLAMKQGYDSEKDVIVQWAATDALRGANLRTAYDDACSLSPTAAARCRVFLPPWWYDLDATSLAADTDYVDFFAIYPEQGGDRRREDCDFSRATVAASFRPPSTLIYRDTNLSEDVNVIIQSADDVRMRGFGVAVLSADTTYAYGGAALSVTADDMSPCYYDMMYFWHSLPMVLLGSYACASGVGCVCDTDGLWTNIITNGYSFRNYDGDSVFKATMHDVQCGSWALFGNQGTVGQCELKKVRAIGIYSDAEGSGFATFGGCNFYGTPIGADAVFEDCEGGNNSAGLGLKNEGTWRRCRFGSSSMGATVLGAYYGDFAGYAEDCHVGADSLGGRTGDLEGKLTGTVINCTIVENTKAHRIEGANVIGTTITMATTDEDCITLLDSASIIHDSSLSVIATGTGTPINAASALNVSAVGNRYNSGAATNGLGANVTNIGATDADADVASILADTGTSIPNTLAALPTSISNAFSGSVTVTSPVTSEEDVELVAGRDYLTANARHLSWSNSSGDWCNSDLTDATVAFTAEATWGGGSNTLDGIAGAVVTATGTQVVKVELTAAQTALFINPGGQYIYQLTFTDASGYVETAVTGNIIVTLGI